MKLRIEPRILLGAALVIASVVGVTVLVNALDRTTPVYVADGTIASGQRLAANQLRVVNVNLGDATDQYLTPEDDLSGLLSIQAVPDGEFVSMSAISNSEQRGSAVTVITASGPMPDQSGVGSKVDIWATTPEAMSVVDGISTTTPASADRIVIAAEVVRIPAAEGFAASELHQIEVRVREDQLQALLQAIAADRGLHVVAAG